ncbi:MAG: pyridoxal phosphate-dependent decarboxylase family protein [Terriglobales bacterium]
MNGLEISSLEFRQIANRMVDLAAEYLESLPSRETFPAEATGANVQALFDTPIPEKGIGFNAAEALRDVLRFSRPPSPRFYGYVLGSGDPVAAAADLLASVLNQNVTAWRSGPAAVTIERTVVRWLAEAIGCGKFSGSLTGGGSSANLMGLMMAREAREAANETGAHGGVVYASSEVHMSIGKAMALLGLGHANLRAIPVDNNFRMRIDELERTIEHDRRERRHGIAVVASAGTTNTGAIDPLPEIADVARRNGLWMHVDGAYGALAAIAEPEKFPGLDHADSLSLDPHKWLYQPLDCGCLLFRDAAHAQRAFAHSGEYARSLYADPVEGFAFFEESMELSRRFRALKVWLSIRYHGLEKFRQAIRDDLRHARMLADLVRESSELELLAPVELSAVCFRHRAGDNAFNERVLKQVIRRGNVYISNAAIHGQFALRACFVNHRTTDADVRRVVDEVLAAGRES